MSDQSGRTPQQIESDIEATRLRLAGTIDSISDRVQPKNVAQRALDSLKAQFVDPQGGLRSDRVAAVGGVVTVLLGLRVRRAVKSRRRG